MFYSLLPSASVEKWKTRKNLHALGGSTSLLLATSIFANKTLQTVAPLSPHLQLQLGFGSGGRSLGQNKDPKGMVEH